MNLSEEDQRTLLTDFIEAVELADEVIRYVPEHFRAKGNLDDRLHDLKEGIVYYGSKAFVPAATDDICGNVDSDRVCMTHLRFIPCRSQGPCEFSGSDEDVERVRAYQHGERDD